LARACLGLPEDAYANAVAVELTAREIAFDREVHVPIYYRDRLVGRSRLDFLIEGKLVLEIKSIKTITDVDRAQVITYLRLARQPLGLIVNFNVMLLKQGIKRIILSDA
jgi:GxxExxY protein